MGDNPSFIKEQSFREIILKICSKRWEEILETKRSDSSLPGKEFVARPFHLPGIYLQLLFNCCYPLISGSHLLFETGPKTRTGMLDCLQKQEPKSIHLMSGKSGERQGHIAIEH